MRTAHQFITDIRPEFSPNGYGGEWASELGSIDAPTLICAGAFESARAYSYSGYYPLPMTVRRDAK